MKRWFTGFMMSWGMFLAIPCPCRIWDEKARPHMVACLPLTGGVVGLVWAALAWLLQRLGCPAPLRAVLLAAAPWLVTGFLHLDGYMDVCDALLSRRDLTTRQKILKDSHCGAFAVICMVLLAAGQCALFAGAPWLRLLPLGAVPVASRACASIAVQRLRPMGTSQYAAMPRAAWRQLVFPLVCLLAAWRADTKQKKCALALGPGAAASGALYLHAVLRFIDAPASLHHVQPTLEVLGAVCAVLFFAALLRALSPEGARARWVCCTGLAAFYFCTCWGLPQLVWQLCTGADGGTPALAAIALALLGLWGAAAACRALGEKAAAGPAPE